MLSCWMSDRFPIMFEWLLFKDGNCIVLFTYATCRLLRVNAFELSEALDHLRCRFRNIEFGCDFVNGFLYTPPGIAAIV